MKPMLLTWSAVLEQDLTAALEDHRKHGDDTRRWAGRGKVAVR